MIFTLTIGGVPTEIQAGSLHISETASNRTTASFAVKSMDGSNRPALDAEVLIDVDGTRIFGGLVDRPAEQGLFGGARPSIVTFVSAVDFQGYAERRVVIDIANPEPPGFPDGYTLHQVLNGPALDGVGGLIAWLAPYGVTIDPAQVTGPTLPQMIYDGVYLHEVFNSIAALTAKYGEPFIWTIDKFKVLRFYQSSTVPAPFDILTNSPGYVIGDVYDEPSNDGRANRVYVRVTPKTETGHSESFVGDGVTTVFTLTWTPTGATRGVIDEDDGVNPVIVRTVREFGDPATWTLDRTARTLTRDAGPLPSGVTATFIFDGSFTGRVMAQHASVFTNPWEKLVTLQDVPDDSIQDIADALLAEALLTPTTIRYTTHTLGLAVGQMQQITVPARALDTSAIITDITTRDVNNRLVMDVSLLAGAQSNVGRRWQDTVRAMFADTSGGGSAPSIGPGGGTSSGAAPPFTSVQFNDSGRFGGKDTFTFTKAINGIIVGTGCTIDPAAMNCQVFGNDNQVG